MENHIDLQETMGGTYHSGTRWTLRFVKVFEGVHILDINVHGPRGGCNKLIDLSCAGVMVVIESFEFFVI